LILILYDVSYASCDASSSYEPYGVESSQSSPLLPSYQSSSQPCPIIFAYFLISIQPFPFALSRSFTQLFIQFSEQFWFEIFILIYSQISIKTFEKSFVPF